MTAKDRLMVALDVPDASTALIVIEQTHEYVGWYKVGLELIAAQNAERTIEWIKRFGGKVFYDAKFNDIPATVGRATKVLAGKVHLLNVHAMCGVAAMRAAVANAGECAVAAVTVLTSLVATDFEQLGLPLTGEYSDESLIGALVVHLATAARQAGVTNLICSPADIAYLEAAGLAAAFRKITPGVRPTWAAVNDQKRIMTPTAAIQAGADILVVGRPITDPPDGLSRAVAAQRILAEITQATADHALPDDIGQLSGSSFMPGSASNLA